MTPEQIPRILSNISCIKEQYISQVGDLGAKIFCSFGIGKISPLINSSVPIPFRFDLNIVIHTNCDVTEISGWAAAENLCKLCERLNRSGTLTMSADQQKK